MIRRWWKQAIAASMSLAAVGCAPRAPSPDLAVAPPGSSPSLALHERVARGIAAASPPASPSDARARDIAADKLASLPDLRAAMGDRIFWGGFDPQKGVDLKRYTLTDLNPFVWAKLYLSSFVFPGEYEVRREGRLTVVEVKAKFRDALDAGDYPYPFWHSAAKWRAYVDADALVLVFEQDKLLAALRRSGKGDPSKAAPAPSKAWDGRWRWSDGAGREQPRVALFTYLFSPDNPALPRLEGAYRSLEEGFRKNNCSGCHAPDNLAKSKTILLLSYPNQALAARRSLVDVLRQNSMPPADPTKGAEVGVRDEAALREILALAEQFEREADAALAFEEARAARR